MNTKRQEAKRKADEEGRTLRSQGDFVLDIERGPGLTINVYNHSLECLNNANIARDVIGTEEYASRLAKTEEMLKNLAATSSYLRYSERREHFEEAMTLTESQYKMSAREKEAGVGLTPLIRGEVPLGNLLKAENEGPVLQECISRGLAESGNPSNISYSAMRNLIKEDVRKDWIAANPGKLISDAVRKTFKRVSGATFTVNYKK